MHRWTVFIAILVISSGAAWAQTGSKLSGHWDGKIEIPERPLPFTIDLARNAKGAWIGSMSITGSTLADLPLTDIAVTDTTVKFSARVPQPATFDGKLSEDGKTVSGTAASANGSVPFQLTRTGDANVKEPAPSSALTKDFEGAWEGILNTPGQALRIAMKLTPAADGSATAILTSIDQGNMDFQATTVTLKGKEIQIEVRVVSGSYHGTLGSSGEIAGEWTQGGGTLPLTFKRAAADGKSK